MISTINTTPKKFNNNNFFNTYIQAANTAIQNPDYNISNTGIKLWKVLFDKKIGFTQAKRSIQEALKSSNPSIKSSGLRLLKELILQNQAINLALNIVKQKWTNLINFPASSFLMLEILKTLIQKNHGIKLAIRLANNSLNSPNENTKQDGIRIFIALVKNNHQAIFTRAQEIAEKQLEKDSSIPSFLEFQLIKELVEIE